MNIILPIFFFVVGVGLFARRMTPTLWGAVCLVIVLVMAKYWVSN